MVLACSIIELILPMTTDICLETNRSSKKIGQVVSGLDHETSLAADQVVEKEPVMRCGFEISKQECTYHTLYTGSLINVVTCSTVAPVDPNPAPEVGPDTRNMFSSSLGFSIPFAHWVA